MLLATVICSDEACAAEDELPIRSLADLDAAGCACGCSVVVVAVCEWTPARPRVAASLALAA